MKIQLERLLLRTREMDIAIDFSTVTFIYGPVGKGKSTVARLVDYCFGGTLEKTPAIQKEFVSVILYLFLGDYECTIERSADDKYGVRVSWVGPDNKTGSVNAPITPHDTPLIDDAEVFCLSDLIFYFCGVAPIKVRKRKLDYDSPLIRLSFRDVWRFCYLNQTHLDSSFYRFEDPHRGRKSQDALRFFTGLYSERLSQIESALVDALDEQRIKREAVKQIRDFMSKFSLGSEREIFEQLHETEKELNAVRATRNEIQESRIVQIHPTDTLRDKIRQISKEISELKIALLDSTEIINQQQALRAELITAKIKAERANKANQILEGVKFERCPQCGSDITNKNLIENSCQLCGSLTMENTQESAVELEALRIDLNNRIDEIDDSIKRREQELEKTRRQFKQAHEKKRIQDKQLQEELAVYDSALVESIRVADRDIATLEERLASLHRLLKMPQAINDLEEQAGAIQGMIDRLRTESINEKKRLSDADAIIYEIADRFKQIMISVGFPGVYETDEIVLDPRNWKPIIIHDEQEWGFWDTGSGGKKTLFNVCFALAIHSVARELELPVPTLLIIDSPTKNISEDENPEIVHSLYQVIFQLALKYNEHMQFFLIDSDLIEPKTKMPGFLSRHMAGTDEAPSLIPYYNGP